MKGVGFRKAPLLGVTAHEGRDDVAQYRGTSLIRNNQYRGTSLIRNNQYRGTSLVRNNQYTPLFGVTAHERQDDVAPLWVVVQERDLFRGVFDDVRVPHHSRPE